mgnify:CR=1 FL=1
MNTLNHLNTFFETNPYGVAALIVWTLAWKGLALWKSATLRQNYWFIALLILNTFGLLEIFYIFVISKKYKVEVIEER